MELLTELIKYTVPGLVVFATAYFLLKLYLDDKLAAERLALKQQSQHVTLPLRLQAYERLMLLCDRMALDQALLRLRAPGMNVEALQGALLLGVSQEFEHNASQQLYVSDTLWQIIGLVKNQTLSVVTQTASALEPGADASVLANALLSEPIVEAHNALRVRAMTAIRTEAGQLF